MTSIAGTLGVLALVTLGGPQQPRPPADPALAAFEAGIAAYVELHRRVEGPVPTLRASSDIGEVRRRMAALRTGIRDHHVGGRLFTPEVVALFRQRIAATVSRQVLVAIVEDLDEHAPPDLQPARINEPLPEDSPFVLLPPRLLAALPSLPPELRYVVLGRGLLLWDHHADMVVDIAPGVFDPQTYDSKL